MLFILILRLGYRTYFSIPHERRQEQQRRGHLSISPKLQQQH